jgi:hypothetical protein
MNKLIKPVRAAKLLGKTEQTLRHWRIKGKGPAFYKSGRNVLYDETEINDWLAERRYQSTSEYVA